MELEKEWMMFTSNGEGDSPIQQVADGGPREEKQDGGIRVGERGQRDKGQGTRQHHTPSHFTFHGTFFCKSCTGNHRMDRAAGPFIMMKLGRRPPSREEAARPSRLGNATKSPGRRHHPEHRINIYTAIWKSKGLQIIKFRPKSWV